MLQLRLDSNFNKYMNLNENMFAYLTKDRFFAAKKGIKTKVDTHSSLRNITERTPYPREFTQTYEDLKGKVIHLIDMIFS